MEEIEFNRHILNLKKVHPNWFKFKSDSNATDEEINLAESALELRLPLKYKTFLKAFGGGEFGLMNVFSVEMNSPWNIVVQNKKWKMPNFLSISDDQTGGFYGYSAKENVVTEEIYYCDFDDGSISKTNYNDVFEFILYYGLKI